MAAVNLVRQVFTGIIRKSSTYKTPLACRLSAVVLQQKYHTVKTAIKIHNHYNIHNGVLICLRQYGSATPKPSTPEIEDRVLKVCKAYDKISAVKLNLDSHFIKDLGLDSLDHVEVIMAMEDEFGFEIPDTDAERLLRPRDIVQYVADKEDIYE